MIALVLIGILCGLYAYWSYRNSLSNDEPPCYPGAKPIIGHAHLMIRPDFYSFEQVEKITMNVATMGGVAAVSFGPIINYGITDPDDAMTVLNTCFEKDKFYGFAKPWIGDGLITAKVTALGVDFTDHALLNRQYVQVFNDMIEILTCRVRTIMYHIPWIYNRSGLKKKQKECLKILHNMTDMVLQRKKSEMKGNVVDRPIENNIGIKFRPFLDLLLELSEEKNAFTDRQIRDHVTTIIVAGHDTSANVLMYTMLMLGSFPHVQDKVHEELNEIFEESDRDVNKHDLCRLVYLEAVIKETIRLITIIPAVGRHIDRNLKLKNCTLSGGRTCVVFLGRINRHSVWGEDANEFKPERWLDPATLPANPNAYATFSLGKRNCIGKAYTMMSMKATLAHVMRNYKVKGDWTELKLFQHLMLKPVSGHHITLERRVEPL